MENGWFYEKSDENWPGQAFGLRVNKVLYEGKTMFQSVLVFESTDYGNVLCLDGVIQATERDEFAYQEMISHIPLMAHKAPKRVLVVGGGDGGCVREVLKHKSVEHVDLVEIDPSVIELSRKYLPKMAAALSGQDPRVHINICDGFEFLAKNHGAYDVIISDTSDPEGPAEQLFGKSYFELLRQSLTPSGIVTMQASENVWLNLPLLNKLKETCSQVFPVVSYAATCVPTYTSGQLGLVVCAKDPQTNVQQPSRQWAAASDDENNYYNEDIHRTSFVLPTFAKKYI